MNNDRFKFRVWWKKENRYRIDTHIILIGYLTDFANSDEYVVEQCTGLKDNCGNLIYEGDIVNYCGKINTVVFDCCGFKFKDNEGLCIEPFRTDVEIIGNIHKQKEQQ